MKTLVIALACTAFALPALAQNGAVPDLAQREHMRGGMMMAKMKEHMAERHAHMEKCYAEMQAAKTPDAMKAIHRRCHQEAEAMRAQAKAGREAWKAHHQGMGPHEGTKGGLGLHPAPANPAPQGME
jgi:hypothetical protein